MTALASSPALPGPLAGLRVIEFAGIGPGPVAAMLLTDMGAELIQIERPSAPAGVRMAINRGKRSITLDLKSEQGRAIAADLVASADALIEGLRPGVMERLGLGPAEMLERNPRLVYGRVTGWGQTGPLAQAAGHDLNYVALAGALSTSRRPGQLPALPPTLVGDMGGGAMFLAFGMVCALLEAQRSGRGQVIDAAMIDGVAVLGSLVHSMRTQGLWSEQPEQNLFGHTAPFYDSYETADGGIITLAAIEPQFYALMLQKLALSEVDPAQQYDTATWPALKARIAARIKGRDRKHWVAVFEGSDACFAPALSLAEAPQHPHNAARGVFVEVEGQIQPAPAPRLSRTPAREPVPGAAAGEHTAEILAELGHDPALIAALFAARVCA